MDPEFIVRWPQIRDCNSCQKLKRIIRDVYRRRQTLFWELFNLFRCLLVSRTHITMIPNTTRSLCSIHTMTMMTSGGNCCLKTVETSVCRLVTINFFLKKIVRPRSIWYHLFWTSYDSACRFYARKVRLETIPTVGSS